MSGREIINSELLVILFVCIFGIAPMFILMFALMFPEQLCTRERRRQRTLDRWRERASLLSTGSESGYVADDEASLPISIDYDSPSLTDNEGSGEESSRAIGSQPLHLTVVWHPDTGFTVRRSEDSG